MAVRTITTEISIKNEAEFKRQIKAVNNSLAGMKSEMTKVSAEFDGQANSAEALRKKQALLQQQYGQQKEKVQALAAMLESAKSAYDDNSDVVLKYQKQLNYATVDLIKFDRELKNTDRYLEEAERSADGTSSSIDEFGKTVKEAGKDAGDSSQKFDFLGGKLGDIKDAVANLRNEDGSFNLSNVLGALGDLKGALVGGAIVTAAKAVKDAIFDIVESTKEYRQIMGTLETSSVAAGYSQEQTLEIYERFQAVLGDTQKAATATANLQALGLSMENLRVITDEAIGAWATYGDSIPIDSLSESINETVQVGKVTGVFADALNWAGTSEDEFNERLAACATAAERANLVLSQLAQQGLQETGQAWMQNNQDIVTYNSAQEQLNAAMAELGELLTPAATAMLQFGATVVSAGAEIVGAISDVISMIQQAKQEFDSLAESNAAIGAIQKGLNFAQGVAKDQVLNQIPVIGQVRGLYKGAKRFSSIWGLNGSHAGGLDYVPFDGYVAELHQGEAVLTAGEANFLRDAMASGRALSGGRRSTGVSDSGTGSTGGAAGTPRVYDLTIPVELAIDGATFARKEYKYRIAEDNRRGVSLAGRGGTR